MAGALEAAQREGLAYFGDAAVFIERYVDEPRHVEVQILADQYGNAVSLGQRDCSIQRNHQKLIEEAPALIPPDMRRAMDAAALHLVEDIGYVGAGTLEFLVEGDRFYFLEMNTRIQVEHTVTELVTGIDLVQAQLRVAAGEGLWFTQEDVQVRGHALQCRINAEDPLQHFAPAPARVTAYRPPSGPGVRIDSHCYQGYVMPPQYDSLLAKLIVWGENREAARRRMLRALDEFILEGPATTIGFHRLALEHPLFVQARATTSFLRHLDLAGLPRTGRKLPETGTTPAPAVDPTPLPGGRRFQIAVDGRPFIVDVSEIGGTLGRRERRRAGGGDRPRGAHHAAAPAPAGRGDDLCRAGPLRRIVEFH
jgi:acetyl-CoA/propionyl-CoA carboxylase biotin carboxyl carrier protein